MFTLGFLKMKYTTISTLLVIYPICLSNADYDLSFNQSEIIMEQGESTQITILMNSTDLWFGGDISINSITSAPGLISSIDASAFTNGLSPLTFTNVLDLIDTTNITYADLGGTGFIPGDYQMATINIDSANISQGQYELNFNQNSTTFYDLFEMPLSQGTFSNAIINIVPAPGALGLALLGVYTNCLRRRKI
jgi:hypothetical protein